MISTGSKNYGKIGATLRDGDVFFNIKEDLYYTVVFSNVKNFFSEIELFNLVRLRKDRLETIIPNQTADQMMAYLMGRPDEFAYAGNNTLSLTITVKEPKISLKQAALNVVNGWDDDDVSSNDFTELVEQLEEIANEQG